MQPLEACDDAARFGGKAVTLARLAKAGLAVPPGVVLAPGDAPDRAALEAALARLDARPEARFAVRSSSRVEDAAGGSAAGLYVSVVGARGAEEVEAAVARVRASAGDEALAAYLAARGLAGPPPEPAVLIQPVVQAERLGVARSHAEGGFLVEERPPGEPEWGDVAARHLAPGDASPLGAGLSAIAALLGGAIDVEYARRGEAVTFLQARPVAPPLAPPADAAFVVEGSWRLDLEHNPAPLSAAQASLVEEVERLGVGARQRVLGGYLYVERGAPPRGEAPIPLAELPARFADEIVPAADAALAAAEADGGLAAALDAYRTIWRRYVGEVAPSLRRARQQLDQLLRMNLGEPLSAHGQLLAGLGGATRARDELLHAIATAPAEARAARLAAYHARFGAVAPAWDVAVPTDEEDEARLLAEAARWAPPARPPQERHAEAEAAAEAAAHALLERLDRMARRAFKALLPLVRAALPIAEDDDLLFFRAQRAVRRALLRRGEALVGAGRLAAREDVFELPFAALDGDGDLSAAAAAGREARRRAADRLPPQEIVAGRPRFDAPRAAGVLVGHGTGGRARGRVRRVAGPDDLGGSFAGCVVAAPALLPSWTPLLAGAAALVTDRGGATSHAATLAREYGVPAVLGTRAATSLPEGAEVWVDADAGRVYLL